MLIIALTGGLGSGKSTAATYFASRGAIILDLDELAARLLTPGNPILRKVVKEFGEDILGFDGSLNRRALAAKAFADRKSADRLNSIIHPALAREIGPALTSLRLIEVPPSVVVLEIPLLVEAPVFIELADQVLAISAPEILRIARAVVAGYEERDARSRVALQASDEQRSEIADVTIVNDADRATFMDKLDAYWEEYVAASPLT